jgi:hypothetical protein
MRLRADHVDDIPPFSSAAPDDPVNLQAMCAACNLQKATS